MQRIIKEIHPCCTGEVGCNDVMQRMMLFGRSR